MNDWCTNAVETVSETAHQANDVMTELEGVALPRIGGVIGTAIGAPSGLGGMAAGAGGGAVFGHLAHISVDTIREMGNDAGKATGDWVCDKLTESHDNDAPANASQDQDASEPSGVSNDSSEAMSKDNSKTSSEDALGAETREEASSTDKQVSDKGSEPNSVGTDTQRDAASEEPNNDIESSGDVVETKDQGDSAEGSRGDYSNSAEDSGVGAEAGTGF